MNARLDQRSSPHPAAPAFTMTVVVAIAAIGLGTPDARAATAPQLSRAFPIDHSDPESNVPGIKERNAKPVEFGYYLQDLAEFAMSARRSGNRAQEARYYLALAKAVPDRAAGFSKACESLEGAGKRDEAIAACRSALTLEGAELKDYVRFVHLLLAQPSPLGSSDKDELARVVAHLQTDPQARTAGLHLQCEVALHVEDFAALESCARALERLAPNDTKTITFLWALAVHQGNRRDADILIARARSQGVAPAVMARLESATQRMGWRYWLPGARTAWAAVAGVGLGAALIALAVRRLRRDRHQSIADVRT